MKLKTLTVDEILKATGGTVIRKGSNRTFKGLSTDSRNISKGTLFLPIIGERFDGHDFITTAIKDGAFGSLVQSDLEEKIKAISGDVTLILVDNTLNALGDIAHFWRRKFEIPVIAITGSSGKTTTKEMVAGIIGLTKKALKSRGNFNNLVGLPLTLLEMNDSHEAAILEMGTNRSGEIGRLTRIAMPDVGLITNIGPAHLEGLKSMDVVREEKWDLFNNMENRGIAIINNDDDSLSALARRWKGKSVTFGIKNYADVRAERISNKIPSNSPLKKGRTLKRETGTSFTLAIDENSRELTMSTTGEHNIYNALAAAASSWAVGIEYNLICKGLMSFKPISGRMEILKLKNGAFLIDDSYNANPASAGVALKTLKDLKGKHGSTVIFGDMLELGIWAEEMHEDIGSLMADTGVGIIFLRGRLSRVVAEGAIRKGFKNDQLYFPETTEEIVTHLKSYFKKGDWVLVKGSRKMKMEEIVQELIREFGLEV
ncbi:MAG: UDP-N-acetylmuramoyl-tripeptide--D-alanyl-D-alanine ligase [Thermodesulfobacteriota bacterium]|nr:UDP-N-acetylmuramoyl-tripeptide--D-alanyl-D-alanine ligase [Thermodesulfobacteriota bacterium]